MNILPKAEPSGIEPAKDLDSGVLEPALLDRYAACRSSQELEKFVCAQAGFPKDRFELRDYLNQVVPRNPVQFVGEHRKLEGRPDAAQGLRPL